MNSQTELRLTVGLVQHACSEDRDANLAASISGIRSAAAQGARLIVLQELHTGVYFCQSEDVARFDQAETIPGPSSGQLGKLAAELNVVIVASLFERRAAGLYHNTAVVLDADGRIAGQYRKMHIPDDPGFHEKFYFTPGDLGFMPIDTAVGRLGVLVCWDQWYPEAARLMALAGAELLIYPTAIGWDPRDDNAERGRQRRAGAGLQSGGFRAGRIRSRTGHSILGIEFRGGPARRSIGDGGRSRARRVMHGVGHDTLRTGAAHLAVPARPSYRRLCGSAAALSGLTRNPDNNALPR